MLFYDILLYVVIVAFIAIPILALAFFISSLKRYSSAKKANEEAPGTFSDEVMRERKSSLIISSVLIGVFVAIVILYYARYMVWFVIRRWWYEK
jgi:hypothetical protein